MAIHLPEPLRRLPVLIPFLPYLAYLLHILELPVEAAVAAVFRGWRWGFLFSKKHSNSKDEERKFTVW